MEEKKKRRLASWLEVFGIDYRSLAFFRIALASLILFDLFVRSKELVAHYTDFGILPRGVFIEKFANRFWISIHMINGSAFFQGALFLIAAVFAVALLIGYKTRLATIVSWFLLISLQSRNPMILQGGDIFFRMLMFWAMFLPLGEKYSLDALRKQKRVEEKSYFSFGTGGILLQFAFVFIFSALLKTGKEWFPDGTAIYYALSIDQFATWLGKFLLGFPDLMQYLTYFVLFVELFGPVLLFFPLFFGQIRTFIVFIFLLLFIGMGSTLNLGPFPWICSTALIVFIPSWFWDKIKTMTKKISGIKIAFRIKSILINACDNRYNLTKIKNNSKLIYKKYSKLQNDSKNKRNFPGYIIDAFAIFFIIFIFLWNVQALKIDAVPDDIEPIAHVLRIDQLWNMFSPFPLKDDGWYVIEGRLKNNKTVDLIRDGGTVSFGKPKNVASMYPHERWRKYLMNLWNKDNVEHRKLYLSYLCRDWNKKHTGVNDKLEEIKMYFMLEKTLPDYQKHKLEKIFLAHWICE